MASAKKNARRHSAAPRDGAAPDFTIRLARYGMPLLLAVLAFALYGPSLQSDFVYDARLIMDEGYITSPGHWSEVLSLQVLGTHAFLKDRPGHLLYMMLNASAWGDKPWGYHLVSNLLHAANVALLFVLLRRWVGAEWPGLSPGLAWRIQFAAAVATLLFALHPLVVEPVSAINFSSDLLVAFFTLLALVAASAFRPEQRRSAILLSVAAALCCLAAVTCKESGLTTPLLLVVYWFLFRRVEARGPWFIFLGAALAMTAVYLAVRFSYHSPVGERLDYLGGSFPAVFVNQPRLWVFMMGQLIWPVHLSADYTSDCIDDLSAPFAFAILIPVLAAQAWLAFRSRVAALGVAIYWLGLATVSNFVPLFHPVADRYYYLPLAGIAVQVFALLLLTVRARDGYWAVLAAGLVVLISFAWLNLERQAVFASDYALWSDTIAVSPRSALAHEKLGVVLDLKGRPDEAVAQYQAALAIDPNHVNARLNMASLLLVRGQLDAALAEYQAVVAIAPASVVAHYNLGGALLQKGDVDGAMAEFRKALELNPNLAAAHNNLGVILMQKGRRAEAVAEFTEALRLRPDYAEAQRNLARAQALKP